MGLVISSSFPLALTTIAQVLAVSGRTVGQWSIDAASRLVERWAGRGLSEQDVVETTVGSGRIRMFLGRHPVVSITSLALDGTAIDTASYKIADRLSGELLRLTGWERTQLRYNVLDPAPMDQEYDERWVFTYRAGYLTRAMTGAGGMPNYSSPAANEVLLPADLESVVTDLALFLQDNRAGRGNVSSERLGDWAASYRDGDLPPHIYERILPYARIA